jgi:hypothetical protein
VGQAFAPGQVYVALSRLTSLDGLILRTKIDPSVVSTDDQVVEFSRTKDRQQPLDLVLRQDQAHYLERMLSATFDFSDVIRAIEAIVRKDEGGGQFEDEEMRSALEVIATDIRSESENTQKFIQQLRHLLHINDNQRLLERIEKGTGYYVSFVEKNLRLLLKHIEEVKQFSRTKTYLDALAEIDLILMKSWEQLDKARDVADAILQGKEIKKNLERDTERSLLRRKLATEAQKEAEKNPKNSSRKTGKRKKEKGAAPKKGATYEATYELVKQGLSVAEIAEKREMAQSTIEGHIAKGIEAGEVNIHKFMSEDDREIIAMVIKDNPNENSGFVYGKLKGEYSYGQIRMVQAFLSRKA